MRHSREHIVAKMAQRSVSSPLVGEPLLPSKNCEYKIRETEILTQFEREPSGLCV